MGNELKHVQPWSDLFLCISVLYIAVVCYSWKCVLAMDECVLCEDVIAGNRIYFDLNMNNIVCMCIKMCVPVTCESLLSSRSTDS